MKILKNRIQSFLLFCALSVFGLSPSSLFATGTSNWKAPEGYKIQIDSSGWSLPVDIEFVKNPQSHPKAPLYYVTELRGRIKVVSQDRSVFLYADQVEDLRPTKELPDVKGQFGLTGLCLDEDKGHLYVTTVYRKGGLLFNKIMRFGSGDGKLGLQGKKEWEMVKLFESDHSGVAHQIGHCFLGTDGKLYVGIGDAHQPQKAQLLEHTSGKLLRINLDGSAPSDNPFYDAQNPESVASYVYAYGFRNPFAITEGPAQQVYVAENGKAIDRLIQVNPGQNYLWSGKDDVMLLNGLITWSPALGPATLIFLNQHRLFPQWDQRLLVSATFHKRIEAIWVDAQEVKKPPEVFLSYVGKIEETQYLVPIAAGPDGVYFSGFMPQADGATHIMKIVPRSQKAPIVLSGEGWYAHLECVACHSISGKGGRQGPALEHIRARLNSEFHVDFKLSEAQVRALTEFLSSLPAVTSQEESFALKTWFKAIWFHFSTNTTIWLGWALFLGLLAGVAGVPQKLGHLLLRFLKRK